MASTEKKKQKKKSHLASCLFDLVTFKPLFGVLEPFIFCLSLILPAWPLSPLHSVPELTLSLRFRVNWFGLPQSISAPFSVGPPVYPYTCVITSCKQRKCETAGGADTIQAAKRGPSDPGWRRSSLVPINANDKQDSVWRQLGPVFLFILNQIHMFGGADAATDVSIRKTWRQLRHNNKCPQHWDVLEFSLHAMSFLLFSLWLSR